jgi:8-amino-7-oxononanoate synthase
MKSNRLANIVDIAQERAITEAQRVAFTFSESDDSESNLTYAQLDMRAKAIAAHLAEQGLVGKRALLLYMPGFDYLTAFYGCLYAGVVAVPAYPPDPHRLGRTLPRLMNIIRDSESSAVLTTQVIDEMAESLFSSTDQVQKLEWIATDVIADKAARAYKRPNIQTQDLAFLQYTSGSTSNPRGVMLTHENILANMSLILKELGHDKLSFVSWLPPYHDMGLLGGMLQPVHAGFHSTLMSPLDFLSNPFKWLKVMSEKKATASAGPNFAYDLCARRVTDEERSQLDLSFWKVAVNGAEPVRAETLQRFYERFSPSGFRMETFKPCYGLAESTLYVTGATGTGPSVIHVEKNELEKGVVKTSSKLISTSRSLVSCSSPADEMKVRIVDTHTQRTLGEDHVGEIWLWHPSVSSGYWNQPVKNKEYFSLHTKEGEGPFMRTGDVGFMHEKELYVTGRLKDLVIIRGRNHYPQDIEETLEHCHDNIRPGCLAAFSIDTDQGEGLAIVVEVKRKKSKHELDQTIDAIKRAVAAQHDIKVDAVALIEARNIPKTSSGKIQRHACKQMLHDGTLNAIQIWRNTPGKAKRAVPAEAISQPVEANLATPYSERVRNIVWQVLGLSEGTGSDDDLLIQHGMDSLMRQELIVSLEKFVGTRLPENIIDEKTSLRSLINYLENNHHNRTSSSTHADQVSQSLDTLPEEYCNFDKLPAYVALKSQKDMLASLGLANPFFTEHDGMARETTSIGGKSYINFSSYNYVGLSGHHKIQQAAKEAIDKYGTSVSASRLVSGERPIHTALERSIAEFVGVEDSIAFVGGHATNVTTIGHLFGPGDLIVFDSLSHNCILMGNELSGAKLLPFPHNDWKALDQILANHRLRYKKAVIIIEGVYSMDGDIPDLQRFVEVKNRHRAFLMVDEAHSSGVLGKTGRGIAEHADVAPSSVDIWMGTLSKSFVSCGGYIAGTKALVDYLRYSAPGFVFSVGMPPSSAAAAHMAIEILKKEPERVEKLRHNSELFLSLAKEAGLNTGSSANSPVVPVILGNSVSTLLLSERLLQAGYNVRPIVFPAVEDTLARLRFFITSSHTDDQIRRTVAAVKKELPACVSS